MVQIHKLRARVLRHIFISYIIASLDPFKILYVALHSVIEVCFL